MLLDLQAQFNQNCDAYSARMGALETKAPLVVAVSGGSDSLALLCLTQAWAQSHGRQILAVTVDHKLRPEAADEARHVAAFCETLEIPHQTRVWDRPNPSARHARLARYRLLNAAAIEVGAQSIWLGHTYDDQLETFLIRLNQGTHLYGAGGIDSVSLSPYWGDFDHNIMLFRPMLALRREDLRAHLRAKNVIWVDDPSNVNLSYLRPMVRKFLADTPKTRDQVASTLKLTSQYRAYHQMHMARMLTLCKFEGKKLLLPRIGSTLPLLKVVLQAVSGKTHNVRHSRAERFFERIKQEAVFRTTLHGCKLSVRFREVAITAENLDYSPSMVQSKNRINITSIKCSAKQ